jgi:hypothetical protein
MSRTDEVQATPICNRNIGGRTIRDTGNLNIPALAGFCEEKFSVRPKLESIVSPPFIYY